LLIARIWVVGKRTVASAGSGMCSRVFLVEQSTDLGYELHQAIRILLDCGLSA